MHVKFSYSNRVPVDFGHVTPSRITYATSKRKKKILVYHSRPFQNHKLRVWKIYNFNFLFHLSI